MRLRDIAVIAGLIFAGVATDAAYSAQEFKGQVPIELIGLSPGVKYYQTLPDAFPLVPLPNNSGLSLVGSVSQGLIEQTLIRSARPSAESRPMLLTAYGARGWINLVDRPAQLYLCHDQTGILELRFFDREAGEHRIQAVRNLSQTRLPLNFTCAEYLERMRNGNVGNPVLRFVTQQAPRLEVPAGYDYPFGGSNTNIGNGNYPWFEITNDRIITKARNISPDALHEQFAAQLRNLGWSSDSSDAGDFSASSVWRKRAQMPAEGSSAARDIDFTLMFTLLHVGDGTWQMTLRTRVNISLDELGIAVTL
jgi:hypothetical protein